MLYVEKVAFKRWIGLNSDGQLIPAPHFRYDDSLKGFLMSLVLRDSDTGQEIAINDANRESFGAFINRYKPYGWISEPGTRESGMLCAFDKYSIDFLGYVGRVFDVRWDSRYKSNLKAPFGFWDEEHSIVECSSVVNPCAFPLFHVLVFIGDGWVDDKFYIRSSGKCTCVEFDNLSKARALLAKAAVHGYNPIGQRIVSYPHLRANIEDLG